jgi:hypothetical protein
LAFERRAFWLFRHCERREAIQTALFDWIASLRSQ